MNNTEFLDRITPLIEMTAQKVYDYYLKCALYDSACEDVNNYISWKIEDNYSEFVDWIDFEEIDNDLQEYIYENGDILRDDISIKIANEAEELVDENDTFERENFGTYY